MEAKKVIQHPDLAVDPNNLAGLSWPRLFGNERQVELEIGIGKGTFLLRRAKQCPERNFLGIEWANEFYRLALDRMQRWGMANVRVLRTDASDFMQRLCPRGSLSVLHIYHPDPWPKRRHNKRRLFQARFVAAATDCMLAGGRISVQTDHAEYFGVIRELLLDRPDLAEVEFADPRFGIQTAAVTEGATNSAGAATNFEIKYRREGRAIYQIAVEKRG